MSYATSLQEFNVDSVNATTATCTTNDRKVGAMQDTPSQIVITWPNARPSEIVVGEKLLVKFLQ